MLRTTLGKICILISVILSCIAAKAQPVAFSVMHNFTNSPDGRYPGAIFAGSDNALYGVTWLGGDTNLTQRPGGTLFKMNRDGSGYQVLHSFSFAETQDLQPTRVIAPGNIGLSAMQGRDGMLYGTMQNGENTYGSVFKCNTDGNDFTILYNFTSLADGNPLSLIQGADGALYGTSWGAIFTLDTQGGDYRVLHAFSGTTNEGAIALGRLLQAADGAFYGTCALNNQGQQGGSIFKITTNGDFTVLHVFSVTNGDGVEPVAGLIQGSDGALYGTTLNGGASTYGTVFKINTDGNGYKILHNFGAGDAGSSDGQWPYCELVQAPPRLGGMLLGTTTQGVNNDAHGTIFTIGLDGTGFNVLYNFPANANGAFPYAGLMTGPIGDTNVLFYGTATVGGSPAATGTLFSLLLGNPPLSITPVTSSTSANQTVLFWPQWAAGYKLQATTNVASGNWVTISNGTPVFGVQVTSTNPTMFYRLVSP